MVRVMSVLLLVNIVTTSYLLFTLSSIRSDVRALKETAVHVTSAVKDLWHMTAGSVPSKLGVIAKHGRRVGQHVKGFAKLWRQKDKDERAEM